MIAQLRSNCHENVNPSTIYYKKTIIKLERREKNESENLKKKVIKKV